MEHRFDFFGFTNCPDVCPLTLKVLADAETPIGLYRKLAQGQPVTLLGATGPPLHHKVVLGEGRSKIGVAQDGVVLVSLTGPGNHGDTAGSVLQVGHQQPRPLGYWLVQRGLRRRADAVILGRDDDQIRVRMAFAIILSGIIFG